MRNLERMISRARNMILMGMTTEQAYTELTANGVDPSLAHWAVRGAQFEIDHWEKENAKNAQA